MNAQSVGNVVKVFVSHKSEDNELATQVSRILQRGDSDMDKHLTFYISGKDYSKDWRATIGKELADSDVLLLLFTAPGKDWDWPLFEAGLFAPLNEEEPKSIVYFYFGSQRPGPLKHLHGVHVDPKSMVPFLQQFYRTTTITGKDAPLFKNISDSDVRSRANEIQNAFYQAATKPVYPTYRIVLESPGGDNQPIDVPGNQIPRNCRIERATPPAQAIFDIQDFESVPEKTWQDLLDSIDEDEWKEQLDQQYERALGGKTAFPTRSTFRGLLDTHNFCAMLTRFERAIDGHVVRASFTFVPEYAPNTVGGPAFNLLRLATRFQYEVIMPYDGKLAQLSERTGVVKVLRALQGSIRQIWREADDLGYTRPANVQQAFSNDADDRKVVGKMFEQYEHIEPDLDKAIDKRDLDAAEAVLDRLAEMNARFLQLISRRHHELVEKDTHSAASDKSGESP